jgi:4-alpha-glucanotransferase
MTELSNRPAAAGHGKASLNELARLHGVQLSYTGMGGKQVRASTETLRAVLAALGCDASSPQAVGEALDAERVRLRDREIEPVVVRDPTGRLSSELVVDAGVDTNHCWVSIAREDGGLDTARLSELVRDERPADDGAVALTLSLDTMQLPVGYHTFVVDGLKRQARSLLMVPPVSRPVTRGFGVVAPLYALRGDDDWGVGSYSDLAEFADLVGGWGGQLAGTLPMFASFFREPIDPSPYLPVSRRFWNELYVDVDELPELTQSSRAQSLVSSAAFRADLETLSRRPDVDHAAVMSHKRRILALCAEAVMAEPGARREAFEAFVAEHLELDGYAEFRAADEAQPGWRSWPTAPGTVPAGIDADAARYHRYVQFVAAEQLAAAADQRPGRAGLYLDLPVGVHPDGYDVWANADLFAPAGVGAPPDDFFAGGQSWGFPPLHPERIREDGYRYLIDSYRSVLRYARAIRIDHVLGLTRLFWIPDGCGPDASVYVRYRSEELRAVIAIESYRAGAFVIGEDLGTVSAGIRRAMDRDRMLHSFVYQFAATPADPLPQPRTPSAASLGSHDLPRFATFWRSEDIAEQLASGQLDAAAARSKRASRESLVGAIRRGGQRAPGSDDDVRAGLARCLDALAAGPASYLLVDLADVELETVPDNRPGTGTEAGNWRHRLRRPLREIADDPQVAELMKQVAAGRRRTKTKPKGAAA